MPYESDNLSRTLGEVLAAAKAEGRTLADVAADAHITRETLSRIVNGRRRPHRLTREAIARALDRDVDELFADGARSA